MKLNMTTQRRAVLNILQQSHDHPTAADVMERLREQGHMFAYGTVYNSLRYLTEAGLVKELNLGESASRYDARTEDHHHIVCVRCGRVDEVTTELPAEWMALAAQETQYQVHHASVVLEGVCVACSVQNDK
ncbi:Fur family transcriptional regulator [Paenibacillus xylaniclasticus]|uniref:Fur family transcriptional regulator n=1 Tax=Paenibacillus xylaniclasticus TaxID=588083 RepID=UPI000FDB3E53|nr:MULTISPECIES: transcriptional repressor [Paenibacillus]GFN32816.1 peroxide operon regulator [Paenibacillus curdlanolyticus]